MTDVNITFCNHLLKLLRNEAAALGIEIPKLRTWSEHNKKGYKYYEVWGDGDLVWSGNAWCASDAKGNYIDYLIREKTDD